MIIYGKQVCLHTLTHHQQIVKSVYVAKKGILPQKLFHAYHDKIKFLEEKWAIAMSKGGNHQGLLVEVEEFEGYDFGLLKKEDFLLVLDGLTDVGNIGAIVRSAYALGVAGVIAMGVRQLNFAAIARSSSGAFFDLPFMVAPKELDVLHELSQQGFVSYGASMEGVAVGKITFAPKKVLVLGNEAEGLSKKTRQKLHHLVSIPMKHDFDSLNVSAAAAILLHRMNDAN